MGHPTAQEGQGGGPFPPDAQALHPQMCGDTQGCLPKELPALFPSTFSPGNTGGVRGRGAMSDWTEITYSPRSDRSLDGGSRRNKNGRRSPQQLPLLQVHSGCGPPDGCSTCTPGDPGQAALLLRKPEPSWELGREDPLPPGARVCPHRRARARLFAWDLLTG